MRSLLDRADLSKIRAGVWEHLEVIKYAEQLANRHWDKIRRKIK